MIHILDNALHDPRLLKKQLLDMEYKSYDFGHCVFHGIGAGDHTATLLTRIIELFPNLTPNMSVFRRSPSGQEEPNFIHTDVDLGQWSAILYLNDTPPAEDGTSFWTHKETNTIGSQVPHERSIEGKNIGNWDLRLRVNARFNRLLLFPSWYFHSRSICENWGDEKEARLIQVVFMQGHV